MWISLGVSLHYYAATVGHLLAHDDASSPLPCGIACWQRLSPYQARCAQVFVISSSYSGKVIVYFISLIDIRAARHVRGTRLVCYRLATVIWPGYTLTLYTHSTWVLCHPFPSLRSMTAGISRFIPGPREHPPRAVIVLDPQCRPREQSACFPHDDYSRSHWVLITAVIWWLLWYSYLPLCLVWAALTLNPYVSGDSVYLR